jgi:uncharacterized protein (DUF433 family)
LKGARLTTDQSSGPSRQVRAWSPGRPAVGGISTEAIAGELDAGASAEEVAEDFGLTVEAIRWAHSYELAQQPKAS